VAPGEKAGFWDEQRNAGVIAIGWNKLGDLADLESREDLEKLYKTTYPSESINSIHQASIQIWRFLKEIKPGDIVVANKGKSTIVGIGQVQEEGYRQNLSLVFHHTLPVNWFSSSETTIPTQNRWQKTVLPLNDKEIELVKPLIKKILAKNKLIGSDFEFLNKSFTVSPDDFEFKELLFEDEANLKSNLCAALNSGKNIMLVGPPGTGKTEIALLIGKLARSKNFAHDYILTTATSDWTTFDTMGGYFPSKDGGSLEFVPGQFLKCFKDKNDNPVNKWLIIDEINRSDIDKAFGQLFTVLSGQSVELPYLQKSKNVKIIPHKNFEGSEISQNEYVVPKAWRLIATLNTYDKASLYQMSYAFMRRFAFIHIRVPSPDFIENNWDNYLDNWKFRTPVRLQSCIDDIKEIWQEMNVAGQRPLGPALIKDLIEYAASYEKMESATPKLILTEVISAFILPQFEGLEKTSLDKLKELLKRYCDEMSLNSLFKEMFEG